MNIHIGLICSSIAACTYFKKHQDQLIDSANSLPISVKKLIPTFSFDTFCPDKSNRKNLIKYLLGVAKDYDGAIFVVDPNSLKFDQILEDSFFTAYISIPSYYNNYKNFFQSNLARLVKNYAAAMEFMNCLDSRQAMVLPLRNFHAPELSDLAQTFRDKSQDGRFRDKILSLINRLKDKKKRRGSKYFFIDDRNYLFEYANERHARLETGPPHNPLCEISGNFRFGRKIETAQHFNVMREIGLISSMAPDCHDELITVKNKTHINMFSNDHHKSH